MNVTLEERAPTKTRYSRANQTPYMKQKKSKQENYVKVSYKKKDIKYKRWQERKEKTDFFDNLNINILIENKNFWKTVEPPFSR